MREVATRQRRALFTDLRHIRCGDLQWFSPESQLLPCDGPPEPQVESHAGPGLVPHGIRLAAQRANKTEPLPEKPDPITAGLLVRVVHQDGLYRSWNVLGLSPSGQDPALSGATTARSVGIYYSESKDGFSWSEPVVCEIEGYGRSPRGGVAILEDPRGSEEERYKIVYMGVPPSSEWPALWAQFQKVPRRHPDLRLSEDRIYCLYGAVSPDGVHWKAIREPLMVHMSDTDTTVYYDSHLDRYVMYTRLYLQDRRLIGRAESEDFRHWSPVEPLIWPALDWPLSYDIYTNAWTRYPGLPEYHFMFPKVYHRWTQSSDVHLYSSDDGLCWSHVPGSPVLTPGEPGGWDGGFVRAAKDLVPLGTSRVAVPFMGRGFPHKYPRWKPVNDAVRVGWAWWPEGRLCAVVADEEGEFNTTAFIPTGRQLRVNVRARRGGEIRVGLRGVPSRTADDCDPIYGDGIAIPVHWKGEEDISVRDGESVTLHFKLRSAELFGFEWV